MDRGATACVWEGEAAQRGLALSSWLSDCVALCPQQVPTCDEAYCQINRATSHRQAMASAVVGPAKLEEEECPQSAAGLFDEDDY